jgi:hypothetical protein
MLSARSRESLSALFLSGCEIFAACHLLPRKALYQLDAKLCRIVDLVFVGPFIGSLTSSDPPASAYDSAGNPLWNGGKWEVIVSELGETSMVVRITLGAANSEGAFASECLCLQVFLLPLGQTGSVTTAPALGAVERLATGYRRWLADLRGSPQIGRPQGTA